MSTEDIFPPFKDLEEEIDRYIACGEHDWQPDEGRPDWLRCTRCRYVRFPHRPQRKL